MAYTPTDSNLIEFNSNPLGLAGTGGVTSAAISNIYDRPRPEFMAAVERHAHTRNFSTYLHAYGWGRGKALPTTGHYEIPFDDSLVNFGAVIAAAGGAGANQTMALSASSMFDVSQTIGGVAARASYVQEGDILENAARQQFFVVQKLTASPNNLVHQVVIRPLLSTVNAATAVLANSKCWVVDNRNVEGGGLPKARPMRVMKYTNTFGITKVAFNITGSELTNQINFSVGGAPNTTYHFLSAKTMSDFERSRGNLLLFGQQLNNITMLGASSGTDLALTTTEGFVPFATTYGTSDQYTDGSYTVAELDAVGTIANNQRATDSGIMCVWHGYNFKLNVENAFQTLLVGNLAPFVDRLSGGAYSQSLGVQDDATTSTQDKGYFFGLQGVRKGGYTYMFHMLDEFSAFESAGNSAFGYKTMAIFSPDGEATDKLTGEMTKYLGYEWKDDGRGYSRNAVISEFAGAGVGGNTRFGQAVNSEDSMTKSLVAEIAGHFACANRLIVQNV